MATLLDVPADVLALVAGLSESGPALERTCRALRAASIRAHHRAVIVRRPDDYDSTLAQWLSRRTVDRVELHLGSMNCLYLSPPCPSASCVDVHIDLQSILAISTLQSMAESFPNVRIIRMLVTSRGMPDLHPSSALPRLMRSVVLPPAPNFALLEELDITIGGPDCEYTWVECLLEIDHPRPPRLRRMCTRIGPIKTAGAQ